MQPVLVVSGGFLICRSWPSCEDPPGRFTGAAQKDPPVAHTTL